MKERVYHPWTWKGKLGEDLWTMRRHLEKASMSMSNKDADNAFAWLEWFLNLAAIQIRKLGLSGNISDATFNQEITVDRFDLENLPEEIFDSDYCSLPLNLDMGEPKEIGLNTIMNEIIHSSVLVACNTPGNPNPIDSLLIGSRSRVGSGRGKAHALLLNLESLFEAIEKVVGDGWQNSYYDKRTGKIRAK